MFRICMWVIILIKLNFNKVIRWLKLVGVVKYIIIKEVNGY